MKNFILAVTVLLLSSLLFSSCSTSCNGNWYHNRNVYESPAQQQIEAAEYITAQAFLNENLVQN